MDVTCVGIICADVLAKPVDRLPESGKLSLIDLLNLEIGGCASNAAIDMAKLGVSTAIIAKIGEDGFGKFLKGVLDDNNINTDGLKIDADIPSSASVVTIGSDSERTVLHCLGANAQFTIDDINLDIVKDSKILLIAGSFLMPKFDGEGTKKLLKAAKAAGVITCLDTAWNSQGTWNKLEEAYPYIDWFMPSYEEACEMSGEKKPSKIAEKFISKGANNILVKLGKDGCYIKETGKDGIIVPGYNVKAIDTSGAGDSFCAGFITGLVKNLSIPECGRLANAVGANCVTSVGTTTGIKSYEAIKEFMDKE